MTSSMDLFWLLVEKQHLNCGSSPICIGTFEFIILSTFDARECNQLPVNFCLSLLHLGYSPVCCAAPRSPAAETAPPAPAPGSVDSSSPLPLPPRAAWMMGDRMTLTGSASPSRPGCVSEETPLIRVLLTDTAHPPDLQLDVAAAAAEALRADSSVGSL